MTNRLYIAITTIGIYIFSLIGLLTPVSADMNNEISLERAIETAIKQNYTLRSIYEKVKIAQEEYNGIPLLSNPELESEFIGSIQGEQNIEIIKSIELGGQRRHRKKIAQINLEKAEHELTRERQTLNKSVKLSFYQLLLIQEKVKLVQEMILQNQLIYDIAQIRHVAGDIAITQVGLANLQLQSARRELATLENKQQLAQLELNGLMGTALTAKPRVTGDLPLKNPPDINLDTLTSKALMHRTDLKSLKLQKQLTESTYKLAKAANIPNLGIGGIVQRNQDQTGLGLKVTIPLPIFDRNRVEIKTSTVQIKQDNIQILNLENTITQDVTAAYLSVKAGKRNLMFYENDLLKLINKNLILTRSAYELGETGLLELIIIQNEYIKSQMDYLDTLYIYQKAFIDLEMAIGTPLH
ncbi:hypothetical protein C6497_12355 [Candidatus Poribacteria bacterium]|nr:MAG: hypothetical protein C6497_12355 [Candidatus Poribacteria bacterium]